MKGSWSRVRRFARRSTTENLGLKLIAFIVALSLLLIVRMQEKEEGSIEIEVNVKAPSELSGVILTSESPDKVKVHLRGRPALIKKVKNGNLPPVDMDLTDKTEPGTSSFFFDSEMFDFPPGIEVTQVKPEAWLVRIERITSRRLPVRVKTFGRLRNGTQLIEEPKPTPAYVTVFGPAEKVRSLNAVETGEVDIEDRSVDTHSVKVPLKLEKDLSYSHLEDVNVRFVVAWTQGQRMLSGLLVNVNTTDSIRISEVRPTEVAVSLVGPQVVLDKLDPVVIRAEVESVDVADKIGVYKVDVKVKGVPADIKIKSIVPSSVLVKITASTNKTKKMINLTP